MVNYLARVSVTRITTLRGTLCDWSETVSVNKKYIEHLNQSLFYITRWINIWIKKEFAESLEHAQHNIEKYTRRFAYTCDRFSSNKSREILVLWNRYIIFHGVTRSVDSYIIQIYHQNNEYVDENAEDTKYTRL